MKRLLIITLLLIVSTFIVSCDSKEIDTDDVASKIIDNIDDDNMTSVSSDRISLYYNIDFDKVDDYSCYIEGSGGFADEVAIFKAKTNADVNDIKEAISSRIKQRTKDFEGYNANEVSKIENNLVYQKGKYILFVIDENPDEAEKIFNEQFK